MLHKRASGIELPLHRVIASKSAAKSSRRLIPRSRRHLNPAGLRGLELTAPPIGSAASTYLFAASIGVAILFGASAAAAAGSGFKKLFRRGRRPRKAPAKMQTGSLARFSVATFNLRGIMDRWAERRPVLQRCLEDIDADILCFQECLTGEYGQERELLDGSYYVFPCKAALFNLLSSGKRGLEWYARSVVSLLAVTPIQRLMVYMPETIEAFRERFNLQSSFFQTLRDLAIAPFFGNSVACRLGDAHEIKHSTLVLGDWRAAQRIEFELGDGDGISPLDSSTSSEASTVPAALDSPPLQGKLPPHSDLHKRALVRDNNTGVDVPRFKVWVVNMHLDHEHPDTRQRQALEVAGWMEPERADCSAIVLCGDFNGGPQEPFHTVLQGLGYRSGYLTRHGCEPAGTWPTGIQAPLMDHGDFECLDYVYVWCAEGFDLKVIEAEVFGDVPDLKDSTLYPSDHAAVKVTLQLEKLGPPRAAEAKDI